MLKPVKKKSVRGQVFWQVRDNVAEFARADLEFHLILAKATGEPFIKGEFHAS